MQYQAKPVIVTAHKIIEVRNRDGNNNVPLTLETEERVEALPDMTARCNPKVGDYWVITGDGYIYLNPKHIFEAKYDLVSDEEPATELPAEPPPQKMAATATPEEKAAILQSSKRQNEDAANSQLRAEDLGAKSKAFKGDERRNEKNIVKGLEAENA